MPDLSSCFEALKEAVERRFRASHPECRPLEEWTGAEIRDFQDDLQEQAQGRISEKWFYMHIKGRQEKLPRIDILNLLSRYTGVRDWETFCAMLAETETGDGSPFTKPEGESLRKSLLNRKQAIWTIAAGTFILICGLAYSVLQPETVRCTFCFEDATFGTRLPPEGAEAELLHVDESPERRMLNDSGCVSFSTRSRKVRFVIRIPNYKPDTITRTVSNGQPAERISLKTDDYALLIQVISKSQTEDWEKRRKQLERMIAPDAQIFQIDPVNQLGMEMYNRSDFINKLTMPLESLKDIEVLETIYDNGKIAKMRFVQKKRLEAHEKLLR
ncbi:MAG: hypothetical protein WD077_10205 [Bacteroidia bacterium]